MKYFSKLGILIVFAVAALIWGLSYLKGEDIFKRNTMYHVIYDRVDGLTKSNDVVLSGYKIGQVSDIRFLPGNSGRLLVSFSVHEPVRFPVNTVAQIISSDLLGSRSIRINLGVGTTYYLENDTLPGAVERDLREEVSMQVLPIKNKAEELLGTIDSAITVLTVIFNEDARKNLSESFENFNQTIYNLEKTSADLQMIVGNQKENIGAVISNLKDITDAFRDNTGSFEQALQNIAAFSDTISQIPLTPILENVHTASAQVTRLLERLESSDNSAGLLLNDDELYESLRLLAGNLNLLTTDLRANPERYLNFSALDLGRKVYITPSESSMSDVIFKVHLLSSENEIPVDADMFRGLEPVEMYEASGAYSYLTGTSASFSGILDLHKKALIRFPDASVVAFKNGRLIRLERALRSVK